MKYDIKMGIVNDTIYIIDKDTGLGYVSNDCGKRFIGFPPPRKKRFIRQQFKYLSRKRK